MLMNIKQLVEYMKKYKQKLEVRKEKIGLWFTNVKEIIN